MIRYIMPKGRLLLSEPNLLLLDEPTNHLDLVARSWLTGFLAEYPHAVVVVSHDRHLLDRACRRIVEVRSGKLHHYTGNFTSYLRQRDARIAEHQSAFEAQQEEIAKLQGFVDRFGAKATKARQAQSRQNVLDKMDRIDAPEVESRPRLKIPPAPGAAIEPISLRNATFGWDEKPIVIDAELTLHRGMRLAILGPNGAGKTTLLHGLAGRLPPMRGKRILGKDVRVGLFTQDLAQDLPADGIPLELVLARAPRATPAQARSALGSLGLSGGNALRPMGELSGGEKARVALACFAVQPCDALLLDEPTNHLDAVAIDALVEALSTYEGALVVVTHDRFLVERVATHVARVIDGKVTVREGIRPEDFLASEMTRTTAAESPTAGADDHETRKRKAREAERARRRVAAIGLEIEALEGELRALDDRLVAIGADYALASKVAAERDAASARIDGLFVEWETLEATLG